MQKQLLPLLLFIYLLQLTVKAQVVVDTTIDVFYNNQLVKNKFNRRGLQSVIDKQKNASVTYTIYFNVIDDLRQGMAVYLLDNKVCNPIMDYHKNKLLSNKWATKKSDSTCYYDDDKNIKQVYIENRLKDRVWEYKSWSYYNGSEAEINVSFNKHYRNDETGVLIDWEYLNGVMISHKIEKIKNSQVITVFNKQWKLNGYPEFETGIDTILKQRYSRIWQTDTNLLATEERTNENGKTLFSAEWYNHTSFLKYRVEYDTLGHILKAETGYSNGKKEAELIYQPKKVILKVWNINGEFKARKVADRKRSSMKEKVCGCEKGTKKIVNRKTYTDNNVEGYIYTYLGCCHEQRRIWF